MKSSATHRTDYVLYTNFLIFNCKPFQPLTSKYALTLDKNISYSRERVRISHHISSSRFTRASSAESVTLERDSDATGSRQAQREAYYKSSYESVPEIKPSDGVDIA